MQGKGSKEITAADRYAHGLTNDFLSAVHVFAAADQTGLIFGETMPIRFLLFKNACQEIQLLQPRIATKRPMWQQGSGHCKSPPQ